MPSGFLAQNTKTPPVANLLPHRQHNRRLLHHDAHRHKLAQHHLPLRLRPRLPRRPLRPLDLRPAPRHPLRLRPHPPRKLGPICRNPDVASFLPPRHGRPNPHRARAAFRSRRSDAVLRPVVHAAGEGVRHGGHELGESVRRRAGAAD